MPYGKIWKAEKFFQSLRLFPWELARTSSRPRERESARESTPALSGPHDRKSAQLSSKKRVNDIIEELLDAKDVECTEKEIDDVLGIAQRKDGKWVEIVSNIGTTRDDRDRQEQKLIRWKKIRQSIRAKEELRYNRAHVLKMAGRAFQDTKELKGDLLVLWSGYEEGMLELAMTYARMKRTCTIELSTLPNRFVEQFGTWERELVEIMLALNDSKWEPARKRKYDTLAKWMDAVAKMQNGTIVERMNHVAEISGGSYSELGEWMNDALELRKGAWDRISWYWAMKPMNHCIAFVSETPDFSKTLFQIELPQLLDRKDVTIAIAQYRRPPESIVWRTKEGFSVDYTSFGPQDLSVVIQTMFPEK